MCSIIGSFDKKKVLELFELNKQRGTFSYSIGYIEPKSNNLVIVDQGFDDPDLERVFNYTAFNKDNYIIMHNQAPTNGLVRDYSKIHPAQIDYLHKYYSLYHNGMLKTAGFNRLKVEYNTQFEWDTYAILKDIIIKGLTNSLKFIDGSFACVYIENGKPPLIFRNQSSILYYDKSLNISSTQFPNSIEFERNKIFKLDFTTNQIIELETFENIEDRYFFVE
jgi:hypothetical protein